VAVIPLTDRRAFLDDFGAVSTLDAPLVKIAERDGTVVYSQNSASGLNEYRLLVQDDTAYLARTVAECRLLATRPPRIATGDAALVFRATGAVLSGTGTPLAGLAGLAALVPAAAEADHGPGGMAGWAMRGWGDVVDQVAQIACDIGPGPDDTIRVQGRVFAKADTLLAQWVAGQKNAASRLLPVVRGPDTVMAVYGQLDWQGQLDRLGQRLTATARDELGEAWSPQIEEAWRGQWEIADRAGPFAVAFDAERRPDAAVGFLTKVLCEQPRAQELVGLRRLVDQAALGERATVEATSAGGLSGYSATPVDGGARTVTVADDHRQFTTISQGQDGVRLTAELVAGAAGQLPPPTGSPAVFAVHLNLTRLARALNPGLESIPGNLPQVDLSCAVRANAQGILTAELDLPLQRLAALAREIEALSQVR
jgi:hypothetical protein